MSGDFCDVIQFRNEFEFKENFGRTNLASFVGTKSIFVNSATHNTRLQHIRLNVTSIQYKYPLPSLLLLIMSLGCL